MRLLSRCVVFSILFALAPIASAEVKNFAFKGVVTTVDDRLAEFDGSIMLQTPIEGFYTFETTSSDINTDSTVGDYKFTEPTNMLVVKIGDYVFRSNPKKTFLLIETVNRPNADSYLIRSYFNVCSRPLGVREMEWQLDDSTGAALTQTTLPASPPVLAQWKSIFGLVITGGPGSYFLRGHITEIVETPALIPTAPSVSIQGAIELKWQSKIGYFYQLQSSDDLEVWTDVGQPLLGDGTELSQFFAAGPDQKKFYRAVITNMVP